MAIEITVPRLGWAMEEGTFAGWLKKDGEMVKSGDQIFTLEGEKALQEIESIDEGILRIPADAPKTGDIVKVGQFLGYLLAAGEAMPGAGGAAPAPAASAAAPTPTPSAAAPAPVAPPPTAAPKPAAAVPVTPRARRTAEELGVDPSTLAGTGKAGRVRERDVRAAAPAAAPLRAPSAPAPALGTARPITALRRTIADRMVQSRDNTVPVTLTTRANATNLVALRTQFKTAGTTPVPSYTDIIAKLTAIALLRHPLLAARWEGENVVLPGAIHLGLAVDTEAGLLVPVLRDVGTLTLPQIARQSIELIEGARSRKLKADKLSGGVFTITNLGGFGIDAFTPIINHPETAILGLGTIRREPTILADGSLGGREQVVLSLSFDHRVVDGAPAAKFLQTLVAGIENPAAWLLAEHSA